MPGHTRIIANCLLVALISMAAQWVMVEVDVLLMDWGFNATAFFSENYARKPNLLHVWVYDVFRFAIFGAIAAAALLLLRPRKVALYASVSLITMIWWLPLPGIFSTGHLFSISLTMMWAVTVPLLYLLFSRISESRRNRQISESR